MASQQPNQPRQPRGRNEATGGPEDFKGFSTPTEWAESFTDAQVTALMRTPRFLQHASRLALLRASPTAASAMNDSARRPQSTSNLLDQSALVTSPAESNDVPHIDATQSPDRVRFHIEQLWSLSPKDISLDRFAAMVIILGGFDTRQSDLLQFMGQLLAPHATVLPATQPFPPPFGTPHQNVPVQAHRPEIVSQGPQNVAEHASSHRPGIASGETRSTIPTVSSPAPGTSNQANREQATQPQDATKEEEDAEEQSISDSDDESNPSVKQDQTQQTDFSTRSHDRHSTPNNGISEHSGHTDLIISSAIATTASPPPQSAPQQDISAQAAETRVTVGENQWPEDIVTRQVVLRRVLNMISRQLARAIGRTISEPISQPAVQQTANADLQELWVLLQRLDGPEEPHQDETNVSDPAEIEIPCECELADTIFSEPSSSSSQPVPYLHIWTSAPNPEQFQDLLNTLDHELILASAKVVKALLDVIPMNMMDRVFYVETFATRPMARDERSEVDLARQGRAILATGELLLEIFPDVMTDVQADHLFAIKFLASEEVVGSMEGEAWDELRSGDAILSNSCTMCSVLMEMMGGLMDIVVDINPLFDFTTMKPK